MQYFAAKNPINSWCLKLENPHWWWSPMVSHPSWRRSKALAQCIPGTRTWPHGRA
jgi:hypothetical protein